jgi:hypothetical protein
MMIGIENILTDLLIFYIPIPIIMKMNLSPKKKGGVLAIFLTGLMYVHFNPSQVLDTNLFEVQSSQMQ